MIEVVCKNCSKVFEVKPNRVVMGWGKYCSRKCQYEGYKAGKFVSCHNCGKEIWRPPLVLARSKSGCFFCDKKCQTIWRNKNYSSEKHANWLNGRGSYRNRLMKSGVRQICRRCGVKDIRVLTAHHKDGNRDHNDLKNLEWLCFNCHFLNHRYK